MGHHERWSAVQQGGLGIIFTVTFGTDEAALGRKQRAFQAGVFEAVLSAMAAHERKPAVQQWGCRALLNVSYGSDAAAMTRKWVWQVLEKCATAAADDNAPPLLPPRLLCPSFVAADADVVLGDGNSPPSRLTSRPHVGSLTLHVSPAARAAHCTPRRAAAELGCMKVIADAMKSNPSQPGIQLWGCRALLTIAVGPLPRLHQGAIPTQT